MQAVPSGHYDSETAAYLAQQGTMQDGTPSAATPGSTPFQDASAAAAAEAASMLPPGAQGSQPVQMPMPHELSASYYGWAMAYQQPLEQPAVRQFHAMYLHQTIPKSWHDCSQAAYCATQGCPWLITSFK